MSGSRGRIAVMVCAVATAAQLAAGTARTDPGTPVFGPEHSVAVTVCGNSPTAEAIATGDFTGDRRADVAVTDLCGFGIRVLPGRGDGGFEPPRYLPTGIAPDGITAGDLDGDGALDLIVANAVGDIVTLYGDGTGGFAEQGRYFAWGVALGAIRTADFDRDGRLDFAVAATPSTVFHNDGGRGAFTGRSLVAGFASVGLETADFDADGNADIVVASGFPVMLTVLYGNGTGNFGRARTVLAPDLIQEAIRVADVDHDGRPDVVGVTSLGGVNVWLGGEDGPRQSNWTIGTPGNAGLALADFDGDDRVDMVVADSITLHLTLWRGDGTGRFARAEWHSAPASVESVEAVDLNGDGKLDLVAGPMVGPWISTYLHN
ncbi:FG-GAP repeat domain-containing protein [Nocardia huaxiensis]|uniref:FG-GAP repeat domain-containing protein n=1 Tax=Nocardia huaxiensis TaxID=2755382 RepID=UPI001E597648|nr:VCBS repeat-containing protein [Nocardia huaxiensis]UFS96880.1 VCBS repeat-containing protein [Nocardia huaxiensis]